MALFSCSSATTDFGDGTTGATSGTAGAPPLGAGQGGMSGSTSVSAGTTSAGSNAAGAGFGGASGGGTGTGGSAGASGAAAVTFVPPAPIDCKPWPKANETVELDTPLTVSGVLDGGLKRYVSVGALGGDGQTEDMPPLLRLEDGSVLKNVIIGKPASDGIHCSGTCYLQNVWWEDVGEDAATLEGSDATQTMTVECAGARHASDKIFQHNGPGTYVLSNVYVEDFGKLYRSCGNCLEQHERHVVLSGINAKDGKLLVGINENYGDTAKFSNITAASGIEICELFEANDTGAEPHSVDSGSDAVHCLYKSSDIHKP